MGLVDRLPSRFPNGTRYVVEGRDGRFQRYLEFPDGRHIDLPVDLAAPRRVRRRLSRPGSTPEKQTTKSHN